MPRWTGPLVSVALCFQHGAPAPSTELQPGSVVSTECGRRGFFPAVSEPQETGGHKMFEWAEEIHFQAHV